MHVVLAGPDLEENLSLRYLSAALVRAGHTTEIAAFESSPDLARVCDQANRADLVGLSLCYQVRAREFLDLAKALKLARPSRPVVAGGHYASCAARDLLERHPELDVIVIHEGERALVELADLAAMDSNALTRVPGIVFRDGESIVATPAREILADLDGLAWPDRSGPARLLVGVPTAYMMGSRGCLGACDYCCISTLHRLVPGRRFRQRRPELIADEMAWLYHERGVRQFIFHDDNFLVPSVERNLERIDALERALRKRGLRHLGLALKCRPADVHREVFLRLKAMGLLRVFLGIESGSPEGLASIGRRQTVTEQHGALEICEDLEISTQYTIILFHPEATPETMLADLGFVRRHLAHPLSFCRAEIYSGTPLEQRMIDAGRALGGYLARTYRYTDPRTSLVWAKGKELLLPRCWSQTHLLGQVVRLDHLASVFRHFYDGRDVDALVAEFLALELEINLDTVELLEALIQACQTFPDAGSTELETRANELADWERASREVFQQRLCDLREALHVRSFEMVGLPRPGALPLSPGRPFGAIPRHAAAALLAVGALNCNSGDQPGPAPDAGGAGGRNDAGIYEAPPPPMDAGLGGSGSDGASGGVGTGGYRIDAGVIEAPPPPLGGSDAGPTDSGTSGRDASTGGVGGGAGKGAGGANQSGTGPGGRSTGGSSGGGAGGARGGSGGGGGASGGVGTGGYRIDAGVIEAPPPPMDSGVDGRG